MLKSIGTLIFVFLLVAQATANPTVHSAPAASPVPFAIHTWWWSQAADAAYEALIQPTTSSPWLDGIVAGCSRCEVDQCDHSVGWGGSPDTDGETTLDSLIMDGTSFAMGAVGALRDIRNAVGVARAVLEYTSHTLLVGSQATQFAVQMGFLTQNTDSLYSANQTAQWNAANCQPNFWVNVSPDPTTSCGPYKPNPLPGPSSTKSKHDHASKQHRKQHTERWEKRRAAHAIGPHNHDTIAMVVAGPDGHMAAGTSTNGLTYKIPGRVGDSAIPGAGTYAETGVGGCGATGDGDIMMRFLPCFYAVEQLKQGISPQDAASNAMGRILKSFQNFQGALFVVDAQGNHAGAAHGWTFTYSFRNASMTSAEVFTVQPMEFP